MKTKSRILLAALCAFALSACSTLSNPGTVTTSQQTVANAVEDTISIGLVPVLTKNASYLSSARGVALALGSFSGTALTPDDVTAFLGKTTLAPADRVVVAGIVNSAWAVYTKRYQQLVGTNLRPDVALFLNAVSTGILNAVAAVPKGT